MTKEYKKLNFDSLEEIKDNESYVLNGNDSNFDVEVFFKLYFIWFGERKPLSL